MTHMRDFLDAPRAVPEATALQVYTTAQHAQHGPAIALLHTNSEPVSHPGDMQGSIIGGILYETQTPQLRPRPMTLASPLHPPLLIHRPRRLNLKTQVMYIPFLPLTTKCMSLAVKPPLSPRMNCLRPPITIVTSPGTSDAFSTVSPATSRSGVNWHRMRDRSGG